MKTGILGVTLAVLSGASALAGEKVISAPVTVEGTGDDQTCVWSPPVALKPDTTYAFHVKMRGAEQGGVAVMGPNGAKMYLNMSDRRTNECVFVFKSPSDPKKANAKFEFGQWHVKGPLVYERAEVTPVRLAGRRFGDIELGYGERIDSNLYSFDLPSKTDTLRNVLRIPSVFDGAAPDWSIDGEQSVTLTHALPGRTFRRARVSVLPDRLTRGTLHVEVSADGGDWLPVCAMTNIFHHAAELPAKLFPAKEIRLRLRGGKRCWARVLKYGFDGEIDGEHMFAFGETAVLDAATGERIRELKPWDYLSRITGSRLREGKGISCWSESSGRKVFRGRPLPVDRAEALVIRTAANEAEAAQLVVTTQDDVDGVRVTGSALKSSATGATIAAESVRVRRVGYLMIDITTDAMGARGRWPDPIFGQDAAGCRVKGGENQPFWVTVKPPRGTPPGMYRGELTVSWQRGGATESLAVPLEVEVFGFELPDRMTCETAFGCSIGRIFRYHRVKSQEDRKTLVDKYMDVLSEHHISPYNPSPLVYPRVHWEKPDRKRPETWKLTMKWEAWDRAMALAFERWHFNTFNFPLGGVLGSGSFISRCEPSISGVSITNNPAAYEMLVGTYLKEVERHLVERGWIDEAYIYWFDEPSTADYDFVMRGNDTLKRHAPRLRRMLTEEPRNALVGGPNLWCPLTGSFYSEALETCRARGDQFWWYITFSSMQPLVNEHVEHSGVDNRLWLWQTWKERVSGILIWELCHWTTESVYTDRLQNPYEDTMNWSKSWRVWNSGEGRYLYPPTACFTTQDGPVLEGPVDSIRLEMLREGIEDYEYFVLLRKQDPTNPLLKVPETVMRSVYDYSTDPSGMETHRLRLARQIK